MGENLWHGYPQHPSSNPDAPWWLYVNMPPVRRHCEDGGWSDDYHHGWKRSDGEFISLGCQVYIPGATVLPKGKPGPQYVDGRVLTDGWKKRMRVIDCEHPLPAPEPRCGQVWIHRLYGITGHMMITSVYIRPDATTIVVLGDGERSLWDGPPPGAVLVAGPGAPWAPTGEGEPG